MIQGKVAKETPGARRMGIDIQVRPADCDGFGHVNNAVYASYFELALAAELERIGFAEDWGPDGAHCWVPRTLVIEYRQAATFGDVLTPELWLVEPDPLQPVFGFEITRAIGATESRQSVIRARAAWQRVTRDTGEPVPVPDTLLAALARAPGSLPRPFSLPPDVAEARRYHWDHTVMRAEVGPGGYAHPQAVYRWIEESVFDACAQSGWTAERRLATGSLVFQTRHDTDLVALPRVGDAIGVTSRVVEVRRLRGTWLQEIHRLPQEELLIRDYSTGVFVDLGGRPAAPPEEMMDQIRFGERATP
jgi:YbgC/YbaW family acyl-CoA thioester hydrolase